MKKTNNTKNNRKALITRKLKMLRKAAACATLFAGLLTGLAQGQTIITGDPATDAVNQISLGGVAIEETLATSFLNVAGNTAVPDGSDQIFSTIGYQLTKGLDITSNNDITGSVVTGIRVVSAASTQTGDKTYEWSGDYNITKSDPAPGGGGDHVTGFEFMHSSTVGQAAIFAGTISGENMTITNNQTGVARGLTFHQNNSNGGFDIRGGFNGTINIESLKVSGLGNSAWGHSTGLFAGNLGTLAGDGSAVNINIDSLDVSSDRGNAAGLDVGNIGNNATLTFGDISADADEYAVALKAGNLGTGVTIEIDSAYAYSDDGHADGVTLGNIGNGVTLTIGNLDVEAYENARAFNGGNIGENVTIKIDSSNTVSWDGYADGVVLGDIGNGTEITIGSIEADGEYGGWGMWTGSIGNNAVIDVTSIDVEGDDGEADGFIAGAIGNGATLTFGDISADADEYAVALKAGNLGTGVTIEIDSAYAYSYDGHADGVILGNIGNGTKITITSIEAYGDDDATGMRVGNIENNVVVGVTSIDVTADYGDGMGFTAGNIGAAQVTIESIEVNGDDATGMSVGDITGPATIKVDSINVGADVDGTGFQAGNIQNGATLTFETINVSADDDAEGFVVARVGAATITIKSVTSTADDFALGVGIDEIGDGARIKIDDIQVDGIYGDGIGFQASIVNQSTLTFGDFDVTADDAATGLQIDSLNSGAVVNINGNGNATTYSYDGGGIATGVQIGSITGATIDAKDSTISAHVTSEMWGTGNGNAFGVSVDGNITDSTLTFKALDATVDNVGTAVGFASRNVDNSKLTVDSINASVSDSTSMFAGASGAKGVQVRNIVDGSEVTINTISAESTDFGLATGLEARRIDNAHVTLGRVDASTDIGDATGIRIGFTQGAGNPANNGNLTNGAVLTVTEGIIAITTTSGNTIGLAAQDVNAGQILAHNADIVAINNADGTDNSTGSAKGVALRDVLNDSVVDLGNVGASVVDDWDPATAGKGDAIGFQARDISASRLSIAHAGAMTFDGDATAVDLRDINDNAALTLTHLGAASMNTGDAIGLSARNVNASTVGLGEIKVTSVGGDAYGVRIKNQVGSDASLVTTGDITATTQKDGETSFGTAYGVYAMSLGSNGLYVNHTIEAVADAEFAESYAIYTENGNNKVTLEKNAVLDAYNTEGREQGLAIVFGANTAADSKNLVVFDTKGTWNNGRKVFNTAGVSDFTFEEGTFAAITGTQDMTTGKDGVQIVASSVTVKGGAFVVLDGSDDTASFFNMATAGNDAGTFHVEEGGSIDAFSTVEDNSAAINGNLVLDGTMTLRFEGDDNVGLYVGSNGGEKGGVITVGDSAKIDVVLDGSFEGLLAVAETAWEDFEGNRDQIALDYISDKISTNTFYNLEAINDEGGYLGYRGRDYVLMPEMFVLASQFHNYRSIYDATADRFALARTQYAGIGACDQACSTNGCDRPMKKNSFGQNAWVNWVGRGNDQLRSRVTGGNMDFSSSGVQVGFDVYKSNRFLVGMMYGYEDGKLNAKDGYGSHMKGEDNYFGFYGQYILRNGFDISGTLGYGSQDFDLVRSNRYGTHETSFDAESLEATLELGYMFKLRKNLTFRPVLALDIYNSDVNEAMETGDWDRSRYSGYSLTQTFLRFGADARLTRKWFSVDAGVYYSYQMNNDAKTVSAGVTSVNQLITRPMQYKLGDSVLTVNVGGNVFLNKARTLSLFGGYYVDFYTDRINDQALHNGRVGVSYRF